MNIDDAKELVQSVFKNSYSEEKYRQFIQNIFEDYEPLQEPEIGQGFFPDSFNEHILSFKRIARYSDSKNKKIEILAVSLRNIHKIERARTMQRNFISWYLNSGACSDAALVAFYSEEDKRADWRLSLVTIDYNYDEEKNRIKKDYSPAKRLSFLIGQNEQVHTACKQFLPLLCSSINPTLAALEETFNIEKVSDEFFTKYKELFLNLTEEVDNIRNKDRGIDCDFTLRNLTTPLFCKKLLGQIVFLYFLQKKGWLGVSQNNKWGTGDKNFLRTVYKKAVQENKNYFNDFLEHLFYEALAQQRSNDYFQLLDCKVPFLNGGLFEPVGNYDWEKYDILIPNEIFSNSNKTPDGDIGDGILDIFDRYNFTVREDEALEKEVAVDPEMLGKVFENLLDVKDRKSNGAFYTPREIVHFMCQETLINFLYNKVNTIETKNEKPIISSIKQLFKEKVTKKDIEDFVRYGDMYIEKTEEIEKTSHIPSCIKSYAKDLDEALENVLIFDPAIGSGAFPIGIMNEIVRARLNLLHAGYIKKGKERNPYNYKRQAIQKSIYGVDIEQGAVEIAKLRFWLSLVVDEESLDEIKPLPNLDYKIMCGNSLLRISTDLFSVLKLKELEALKNSFYEETNRNEKTKLKNKINAILTGFVKDGEFDPHIFFSEVFSKNQGFDIIIGNPPYVQLQRLKNEIVSSGINKGKSYSKLYSDQNFETYEATGDIYCLFYEKGINLLRENGILCFITSNKWMRAGYGEKLRAFFTKFNPKLLIDLGAGVFASATVDTNILLIEKKEYQKKTISCVMKNCMQEMSVFVRQNAIEMEYTSDSWVILSPIEQSIKAKIEKYGTPLKDWNINIYRGILTGCNEAFIISGEKRAELIAEDPKSDEIIRPILRGRDIKRYGYDFADLWLINIECGFTNKNCGTMLPEEFIKFKYPAIYKHFMQVANTKTKGKGLINRDDKGDYWWELRSCAYTNDFSKQKIMYSEIVKSPQFYLDNKGEFYPEATTFIMTGSNLEYLLLALNSKVLTYAFKTFYAGGGLGETGYRYKKAFLELLPIPQIDTKDSEYFLKIIKETKYTDFDTFLFNLYDFTDEEKKIIGKS